MSSMAISYAQPPDRQEIGKPRSNTVFDCLELASKIGEFTPEIASTQKVLYQTSYETSLQEFCHIIGPSKYVDIAMKAIGDIKRNPTFNQNSVSYRLGTKRIFVNLFNTIKKLNGYGFLKTLFPEADLRSPSSVIDHCIYPQVLEQMHAWIEDTNLIKMASRIDGIDENLRSPLASNSLEATQQRAECIRAWLHGHNDVVEGVTDLDLFNLGLTSIPPEINLFTNLRSLTLNNNQIAQIPANAFSALINLQTLFLAENQITQIDANAFSALVNLKCLDLSFNQIAQINPRTFSSLVSLQTLYLSRNHITQIDASIFSALIYLKQLYLSNNQIAQIHPSAFSSLVNLRTLYLFHNQIAQIHPSTFSALVNLQELRLSYNLITQLSATAFSNLGMLEFLELFQNPITQIHANAFSALVKIVMIYTDNINVDSLPDMSVLSENARNVLLSHLHVIPSSSSSASAASTAMSSSALAPIPAQGPVSDSSCSAQVSSPAHAMAPMAKPDFSAYIHFARANRAYLEHRLKNIASASTAISSSALRRVSVSQGIENMAHVGLWSRISNFFTSILGRMLENYPCG